MIIFLAIAIAAACVISSLPRALFQPTTSASHTQVGPIADLMAQAEACVGTDPHEAQALRSAACNFLRVATQR